MLFSARARSTPFDLVDQFVDARTAENHFSIGRVVIASRLQQLKKPDHANRAECVNKSFNSNSS